MRRVLHIIDSLDRTDAAHQLRVLAQGLRATALRFKSHRWMRSRILCRFGKSRVRVPPATCRRFQSRHSADEARSIRSHSFDWCDLFNDFSRMSFTLGIWMPPMYAGAALKPWPQKWHGRVRAARGAA